LLIIIELANDVFEIESRIKKSKEGDNGNINDFEKPTVTPHNTPVASVINRSTKKNIIIQSGSLKSSLLVEGDLDQFKNIDEVVDLLISQVEGMSRDRVLDALIFNSFNIDRAFCFLKEPEEFSKGKTFCNFSPFI
jgi:hypothetical protein